MPTATGSVKPKVPVQKDNGKPSGRLKSKSVMAKTTDSLKPKIIVSQTIGNVEPKGNLSQLCQSLRSLQRQRVCNQKSRIMIDNRLVATLAWADGYHPSLGENAGKQYFDAVRERIARVKAENPTESATRDEENGLALILATLPSIAAFDDMVSRYEKQMIKLAKQLPAAAWVEQTEQRGFGMLQLAIVVGECGDLNNYEAPGKLWRRMGCAPFESKGKMKMPSTWRKEKGLSAEEWEECGYSPRRRSIAYLIGESLVKQNQTGPYRKRYDAKKKEAGEKHPEWIVCKPCKGSGKSKSGKNCGNCKGTGDVWMHCHLHGMLLASKLLLKNLWIEWTDANSESEG